MDADFKLPPITVRQIFTALSEQVNWAHRLLGISELWKETRGAGVRVAVLDSGATPGHPDLKEAIVASADMTNSPTGVKDVVGHSTHVCGIIGARANDFGVIGIAPECELLVAKVLDDDGVGSYDTICAGIHWALDNQAKIVNLSFGSPLPSPQLQDACRRAAAQGAFLIAAAGNSGVDGICYPAQYDEALAVGAVDPDLKIAHFSSRGGAIDIVAPGVKIVSDYPPDQLATMSGTSQAAPIASGIVALYLAHLANNNQPPPANIFKLIDALHASADHLGADGPNWDYGYGLIDPKKLFQMVPNA